MEEEAVWGLFFSLKAEIFQQVTSLDFHTAILHRDERGDEAGEGAWSTNPVGS